MQLATIDVAAPMTGTVLKINVSPGEAIAAGDEVVIVESMKMELPIESPQAGTVAEVLVSIEDHIDEGDVVLRLESA
jgi:biotin carboxyl carrier protein